ncbi:cytochrome P460 family protein [Acidithiobacillus thiooxidans]|uniref:cytochrome P460 family protein n=1 Tax=Acidithiobacillus thiooxidans TaxID=930 RepID=UPI000B27FD0B|nr:cytochrome P460 family protein [Acidithiobacillus thiooxidans]
MQKLNIVILLTISGCFSSMAWAHTAGPSPEALWKEVQILQKTHAIMPGSTPFQLGSRTVDPYTVDLANTLAISTIKKAGGILKVTRYSNGSLVVKENYNAHKQLVGVTAMLKAAKYDPSDRNWIMAAYDPTGKVLAYGKVGSCIACHVLVRHQDLVFAPPPTQLLPITTWKAFFSKQEMNPAYVAQIQKHPGAVVQ